MSTDLPNPSQPPTHPVRIDPLKDEMAALLAEIDAAFEGVNRQDGVSWSESRIIDDRGSMEERLEARRSDTDQHWSELVHDRNWHPDMGIGGFSFLDPIGFRYYLPPAMKRCMALKSDNPQFHLTLRHDDFDNWHLEKWSLLDLRQRRCIARFIRFMMARLTVDDWGEFAVQTWQETLDSYWYQFDEAK